MEQSVQRFANFWKAVTDPHSALRYLNSSYVEGQEVSDDYVIALAAAKKAEAPEEQGQISRAVQLIAAERNSTALRAYVKLEDIPISHARR